MNKEWVELIGKYEEEGARKKFENICTQLYKIMYSSKNVRNVEVKQGDGGIDIFIGEIGIEPISIIQCKFFKEGIGEVQQKQIRNSFSSILKSSEFEIKDWTLCVINTLNLKENQWWSGWKKRMTLKNGLYDDFISLKDGDDLLKLIIDQDLYNISFEKEDSIKIDEIHKSIKNTTNIDELREVFKRTSFYISKFKNYFGDNPKTHIERQEVDNIIKWIDNDLPLNQKNILTVEGEKGNGKTVIIKDVYDKLQERGELVLCIKSDKYHDESPIGLEGKLFANSHITFSKIKEVIKMESKKLVVIIDQLDSLSQTLSANREYLHTYNRIISELEDIQNIRVVISVRSFDLKYDANLSIYDNNDYRKIKVGKLPEDIVIKVLNTFNIVYKPQRLIELLKTPNHLEIFTKLPIRNKINTDNLYSLKDLFDGLWQEIISSKPELKTKELLYKIANEMYENEQKIVVQNKFNDLYFQEMSYLKSNQILIEDNNEIQFFHQTLYDYCFSRQFIDNGNQLQSYILENGQSIYIRSVIKMIVEYLRETDHKKYTDTLKTILKSKEYRFHVKTLILLTLGLIQKPTEKEKQLVLNNILYNEELNDVFLNSIHSDGWLLLIIEEKYFDNNFIEKIEITWQFFRKNITYQPIATLKYLEGLEGFDNKHSFIERVLIYNGNWKSQELLPYFENYITYHVEENKRNLWYFDILGKIADYHLSYTFDKFRAILLGVYDKTYINDYIDSHIYELIKKLDSKDAVSLFNILLNVYNEAIEQTKYPRGYDKVDSPYYLSHIFYPQLFSKRKKDNIEDYLLKYIVVLANNREGFIQFFDEHKDSNSLLLLSLIIEGLKENVEIFKKQILELIQIISSKNGFKVCDDNFQFSVRKLIGATFSHFSKIERDAIIKIINTISSPYEGIYIFSHPNSHQAKQVKNSIGNRKYLFLKSIPYDELRKITKVNRDFQELSRKFEPILDNKPLDEGVSVSVGNSPPIPVNAQKQMSLQDWENSMIKFNDTYKPDWYSDRGGIDEHAKSFSSIVKQNPQYFDCFINSLFDNPKISKVYILYGVEGLLDGEYNLEFTKDIFKKLLKTELNPYYQYTLISKAKQIINKGGLDKDIFYYLKGIVTATEEFKESEETDLTKESLVSIRGEAIEAIIYCYKQEEYAEQIFQTVEKAIEENNIPINLSVIRQLAHLNHLNIERSFEIFKKIVDTDNIEILKNSFWSAQYLNNKFHYEMYPYFEKIIEYEELHKNGNTIVISWINDKINDKELYEKFISKSKSAKLCAINIAEHNLLDDSNNINEKCLSILYQFINENEEREKGEREFAQAYAGLVLRQFKDETLFPKFESFLLDYSVSNHCKNSPSYFLEYLIKCSKIYPLECLTLLKNIDFSKASNVQYSGYFNEEPVQLLLAIYSVLSRKPKVYKDNIEDALNLFDEFMKINHLRETSYSAIDLLLN